MTFYPSGPSVLVNSNRKELVMKLRSKLGPVVIASVFVLCGGQVALAQVEWTFQGVCVEPGDPGTWDSGSHMLGDVVFDGTEYHMYLTGGEEGTNPIHDPWSVGHWTSTNKLDWEPDPDNPVLGPGDPGWWDGFGIINVAVHFDGVMFHMWYGAWDVYHGTLSVGYATSSDGSLWANQAGPPLPGLGPGDPGQWCDFGPAPRTVLRDGASLHMWYTAFADIVWPMVGTWRIGYATSTDGGLSWTSHPEPVLVGEEPWEWERAHTPEVVPWGPGFAMWYTGGYGSPAYPSQVGFAISPDGLHWGRWPDNPVLVPEPPCDVLNSIAVIIEDDTVHGWVSHCDEIHYVTAPREVVFFDGLETGDTTIWSGVVPY
jgi:hypothetical protein